MRERFFRVSVQSIIPWCKQFLVRADCFSKVLPVADDLKSSLSCKMIISLLFRIDAIIIVEYSNRGEYSLC